MLMYKSKKGNVIAAVLVIIVILTSGLVYVKQNTQEKIRIEKQDKVFTEAEITLKQSISLGINELMLNGFSNKSDVWFCNNPLPPNYEDEVKDSLNEFTTGKIDSFIDNLLFDNPNYLIEKPKLEFSVGNSFDSLDPERVVVEVSDFRVGIQTEDLVQYQDISQEYVFPYRVWFLYTKMFDWMNNGAGNILVNIQKDGFQATPCQAVVSTCTCQEATFDAGVIENMKFRKDQLILPLDNTIRTLTDSFNDESISCSYEIERVHIENEEKTEWKPIGWRVVNGTINQAVDIDENSYKYKLRLLAARYSSYRSYAK